MGRKADKFARGIGAIAVTAKSIYTFFDDKRDLIHTITWQDDSGDTIDVTQVKRGEMPSHETPVKQPKGSVHYEFAEWIPAPRPAYADVSYRARFLELDEGQCVYPFTFFNHATRQNVRFFTYYSDDYFKTPATGYNESLATFGLCLELSSGNLCKDSRDNSANVIALLRDIGCDRIKVNDYYTKPKRRADEIAVAVGVKDCDIPTMFVVIKGVNYGSEFAGNMLMGKSGESEGVHKGFSLARDCVIDHIKDSIDEFGITGRMRMMVVGYSRAGATSNLVSSRITDMIHDGSIREWGIEMCQDDMYGFCYEPALCQTNRSHVKGRYDNIVCVVDPNDIVAKIPPRQYDFTLYGRIIELPSNNEDARRRMRAYMERYFGRGSSSYYIMDEFVPRYGSNNLGEMVDRIMGIMVKSFGNREFYAIRVEDDIAYIIQTVMDNREAFIKVYSEVNLTFSDYADIVPMIRDKEIFDSKVSPYVKEFTDLANADPKPFLNVANQAYDLVKRMDMMDILSIFMDAKDNYRLLTVPHIPLGPLSFLLADDPNYKIWG